MACPTRPYIVNAVSDPLEQDRLNKIHDQIGAEAVESKLFRNEDNKLMLLKNKFREGTAFISRINQKYGKIVASLPKVQGFRHKLQVNTLPLQSGKQEVLFSENINYPRELSQEAIDKLNSFMLFEDKDKLCSRGICNYTAQVATNKLTEVGLKPFPNATGSAISVTVKSPLGNYNIEHFIAAVALGNGIYVYDMPQNEYISDTAFGEALVNLKATFKPRLIPLTKDEIKANYNLTDEESLRFIRSVLNTPKTNINPSFEDYIKDNIINGQDYINELRQEIKDGGLLASSLEEYKKREKDEENARELIKQTEFKRKLTRDEVEKVEKLLETKLKLRTREYIPKTKEAFYLKDLIQNVVGKTSFKYNYEEGLNTVLDKLEIFLKTDNFINEIWYNYQNEKSNLESIDKQLDLAFSDRRLMLGFLKNAKIDGIDKTIEKYDSHQKYTIRTLLGQKNLDGYKSESQKYFLLQKYFSDINNYINLGRNLKEEESDKISTLFRYKFIASKKVEKARTVLNFLKIADFDTEYIYRVISNEARRQYNYFKGKNIQFSQAEINYQLRAALALESPKVRQPKSNPQGFYNDLQKQGLPKDQIDIIKSLSPETKTKEELLTDLLANYSFTVEVQTAKQAIGRWTQDEFERNNYFATEDTYDTQFNYNGYLYSNNPRADYPSRVKLQNFGNTNSYERITEEEYNRVKSLYLQESAPNSSDYANLTVPGWKEGSYKELKTQTPQIIPSIKAHAQFADDNTIAWSRVADTDNKTKYTDSKGNTFTIDKGLISFEEQSDLFQKGREKDYLVLPDIKFTFNGDTYDVPEDLNNDNIHEGYTKNGNSIPEKEYFSAKEQWGKLQFKENVFLQLLNKDSNWVRFKLQSTIQFAAKNGYETVLFPTGDTASKVEGHTTLEEFKRQKEERIKQLEENIIEDNESLKGLKNSYFEKDEYGHIYLHHGNTKTFFGDSKDEERKKATIRSKERELKNRLDSNENELEQLKSELERIETEGFAALRPIWKFYEETVGNTLKKLYGKENVERIKDEYGNEWWSLDTKNEKIPILLSNAISKVTPEQLRSYNTKISTYFGDNGELVPKSSDLLKLIANDGTYLGIAALKFLDKLSNDVNIKLLSISEAAEYLRKEGNVSQAKDMLDGKYSGFYSPNSNEIIIVDRPNNFLDATIIHEIGHAITWEYLRSNNKAKKEFVALLNQIKKTAPEEFTTKYSYQLQNPDEFFSALSNKNFIKDLSSLPSVNIPGNNLWQDIKDWLSTVWNSIFGSDRTLLDDYLTVVSNVLEESSIYVPSEELSAVEPAFAPIEDFQQEADKITEELKNVTNTSEIVKSVDRYYKLISKQIKTILDKRNTSYDRQRATLRDENESLRLVSQQSILSKANKMAEDVEGIAKRARALATGLVQINYLLDLVEEDITEILKDEANAIQNIGTLQSYLITTKEWGIFLGEVREFFQQGNPSLRSLISNAEGKIRDIENNVIKNDKSGLVQALKPILSVAGNKFITEFAVQEMKSLETRLNNALRSNNTQRVAETRESMRALERLVDRLDFENNREILDTIEGKTADTNALSIWIESFRDSPDFGISSLATYLRNNLDDVDAETFPILKDYELEIAPFIDILGGRFDPASISNLITVEEDMIDKDGNEYKELVLLNPSKGAYKEKQRLQNIATTLKNDLKNAKGKPEEKEIREFYRQARRNLLQHQLDYWHLPLKSKFYEKYTLYDDEIGHELKEDADEILDDISDIQDIALAAQRDLTPEEEELIDIRWKEYTMLGNLNNIDGTPKTGVELLKAERMREIRALNREIYDWIPNIAKFERDRALAVQDIIDLGKIPGTPEYTEDLGKWELANTRTVIKDSWYKERDIKYREIGILLRRAGDEESAKFFKESWDEIKGLTYGLRDEDNQPIGIYVQEKGAERIKSALEAQEVFKQDLRNKSSLTDEENEELLQLENKNKFSTLTSAEKTRINELYNKQKVGKLTEKDKKTLGRLFAELAELQTKAPTEYYVDAFNQISQKYGVTIDNNAQLIDGNSLVDILDSLKLQELLTHDDFSKWFNLNHYQVLKWNPATLQMENKWQRTYQWNRIIPTDSKYYETTKLSDGTILPGVPARKYSYRKVKDEFIIEPIVGKNVDNRGNNLPKTIQDGAKDAAYTNPEYTRLKNSNNPKDKALFGLLETHKKFTLLAQEGLPENKKLWLTVPKVKKTTGERNIEMIANTTSLPALLKNRIKSWWDSNNEFESGTGNFQQKETSDIIRYGTDVNMLPMKYTGKLDASDTSRDLFRSISKYLYAARTNIKLAEISPVTNALERVITQSEIKKKNTNPEIEETNRAKAIRFLINREIKGKEKARELGTFGEVVARLGTSLGYTAFIRFGYPSSIANVIQGIWQGFLDAGNGRFSKSQFSKALLYTLPKQLVPSIWVDYGKNELGVQSLYGQMIDLWEPLQGIEYENIVGEKLSATKVKDLVGLNFALNHRAWGEFIIQSTPWLALMDATKIEQTLPDKSKKTISLWEMYELDSKGIIKLKDGVPKEWDFNGAKFKETKAEAQKINSRVQGNMAKKDAPMAAKFTTYNLVLFLNRWFVEPAINRWAADQVSVKTNILRLTAGAVAGTLAAGALINLSPIIAIPVGLKVAYSIGAKIKSIPRFNVRTGYQWGWNMSMLNALSKYQENGIKSWDLLTDEEKRGLIRNLNQLTAVLVLEMILMSIGLGGGDDDKKKKEILANMSPEQKMLVYQLMRQQVEIETFDNLPQYFFLGDNLAIYQGTKKWTQLMRLATKDLGHLIYGEELEKYKRQTGSIKPGTSKTYVQFMRATGLQGISNTFDDQDLAEFVKNYDSNIRSKGN